MEALESRKEVLQFLREHQNRSGKDASISTLESYSSDIFEFLKYSREYNRTPNEEYSMAEGYIKHLGCVYSYYTIQRKLQAISFYFHVRGKENPFRSSTIKAILSNLKRSKNLIQKQAPAFTLKQLRKSVEAADDRTLTGIRNKAILLVGFVSALRKSELLALRRKHVLTHDEGLILIIEKSKTNQFGHEEYRALFHAKDKEYCPVRWLQQLLQLLPEDPEQPLFTRIIKRTFHNKALSGKGIDKIIKKLLGRKYSSHSFRSSFVTIAKQAKLDDLSIMRQTHHTDAKSLDRYTRFEDIMVHNAAKYLPL